MHASRLAWMKSIVAGNTKREDRLTAWRLASKQRQLPKRKQQHQYKEGLCEHEACLDDKQAHLYATALL